MTRYMAHSPSQENQEWQTLKAHLEGVTARLEHHVRYLTLLENVPELLPYAKLTGYLHDLGKYRDEFQKYRLGWDLQTDREAASVKRAIPHSDAGAKYMRFLLDMDREVASELPFVIANHHGRLKDLDALEKRLHDTDFPKIEDLVELAVADLPELGRAARDRTPRPAFGAYRTCIFNPFPTRRACRRRPFRHRSARKPE